MVSQVVWLTSDMRERTIWLCIFKLQSMLLYYKYYSHFIQINIPVSISVYFVQYHSCTGESSDVRTQINENWVKAKNQVDLSLSRISAFVCKQPSGFDSLALKWFLSVRVDIQLWGCSTSSEFEVWRSRNLRVKLLLGLSQVQYCSLMNEVEAQVVGRVSTV